MHAIRLRTEHLCNPIGVDWERPRLFWNAAGGVRQSGYQIVARDESGICLWDSGRVESSSMHASWGAVAVPPCTRVYWKVRLFDESGLPGEDSEEAFFETGLPKGKPWHAAWIKSPVRIRKNLRYPVDCFRKEIVILRPLSRARLYLTACGLYEARLDGKKVGSFFLAPGYTDYRKRVQYQTYDVTGSLSVGPHVLTVQLADGWFRGSVGAWGRRNEYGTVTRLLGELDLRYQDGTQERIGTDASWAWSADGPIRFADNKDGEIVEAFRTPSYSGRAKETTWPVIPTCSDNVPVTAHEVFHPVIETLPDGRRVLDFGQNLAGILRFSIRAHRGDRLVFRFGELRNEDGTVNQRNIQCVNRHKVTPLQKIEYTCREGENRYQTTFAIFGFRYAEVECTAEENIEFAPDRVEAVAVYSDLERTGTFTSSNPLLNQFFRNTVWSAKNNSCDVPTDCPTRERHGWTGDAQIFSSTANYLFDYLPFTQKYLRDLYDAQSADGKLPQIVPTGGTDPYMKAMDGSAGWADAGIILPYTLWKQYHDPKVIRAYLPGMRRYVTFLQRRCGRWYPTAKNTGLKGRDRRYLSNYGQAYGEWAEPEDVHRTTWKDCAVPHPEVATAYTAYVCRLMAEMEKALSNEKESRDCLAFAGECEKSYQALMRTKAYSLDTDRQARLVRPLAFGLLDEEQTAYAKKRLIEALQHYGWRVGTGFLSTPLLLDVLTGIDPEYAYRLLENEEMPGWLYMPKRGATTVWESWEGPDAANGGIASLDHYSKGAVCHWLFDTMCGIRLDKDRENAFVICPVPGGHFTFARAAYQSVFGAVESGWKVEGSETVFTVTVPSNCEARVILPGQREILQQAGTREYRVADSSKAAR
jgi:alpha-L-rhamnosidase